MKSIGMKTNFLITLLIPCSYWFSACSSQKPTATNESLFELEVAEAISLEMPYSQIFTGQTYASDSYVIQPRVTGYLIGKYFSSGEKVNKGDLLFQIDPAPFNAAVMKANADMASANATFKAAESNYKRSVPLARINAISQSALDQAVADFESGKESVKAAKAALELAKLDLSYTRIYAPASGYIAPSKAAVGDYVGGGTAYTQLTTIYSTDSIIVYIYLPVREFMNLQKIQPGLSIDSLFSDIRLIMPNGTFYEYPGTYDYTEPSVSNETGAMVVHLSFPNTEGKIRPGTFARILTGIGDPHPMILIPQRAVSEVQGLTNIYVVNPDSTLSYKAVEIAFPYQSFYAVSSGINPGEQILVNGLQKARSGMKIKPVMVHIDTIHTTKVGGNTNE